MAWLKGREQPAMLEAALLKLYLSECFVASGLDAVRIHSGNGHLTEYEVERDLPDAIGGVIYLCGHLRYSAQHHCAIAGIVGG